MTTRTALKFALPIAAGVLAGVVLSQHLRSSTVPIEGALTLYASDRCPHSLDLLGQVEQRSKLMAAVLVLPTDFGSIWSAERCRRVLDALPGVSGDMMRVLPEATACAWVEEQAVEYYRAHFTYTPAWSIGARVIEPDERDDVLAQHGLLVHPQTNELLLVGEEPRRRPKPVVRRPVPEAGDPMLWATGHTVGM